MGRSCRRSLAACAFVVTLIACSTPPAFATSPAKMFPGFAAMKDSLGVVPMVADVVVAEDVLGNVEKVYLDDCKVLGAQVLAAFDSAMTRKGYKIERRPLLSVGGTLNPEARFNVLSTWSQHTMDVGAVPVSAPPFFVDSTQCPDAFSRSTWNGMMKRVAGYRMDGSFPGVFPEALSLRDTPDHRFIFVITVVSVRVPQGKSVLHSMITPPEMVFIAAVDPCNPDVNTGIVLDQVSSTLLKVAMVDRRHPEAVWADSECQMHTFSENQIDHMMKNIIKRLP